jgi:phosphate-selective porin OprO/OprP
MTSLLSSKTRALLALSLLAIGSTVVRAQQSSPDELQALRDQVRQLDQKLKVIERKQELKDEDAAAAAKTAPKIALTDKGFTFTSADSANSVKIRGLVQLDSRLFFDDGGIVNNAFIIRRARLISEGTFAKNYSFQLVPEFGGGSGGTASAVSILDANFGVAINKALQFKFGKYKSPVGLELLQSDSWTFFNERSLVTNLVPNRDVGIQASGDLFSGTINYTLGVFGGVPDGGTSGNSDFDEEKDVVARVFASPFKNKAGSFVQGLSFGIAGSAGREKTAAGRTSGYRTDGQQTFFSYLATTISDGQSWRVSPQADFRKGSFGAIGEYVISTVNVRPSATGVKTELQNKAWQVSTGYVLTGEDSSYAGVVPKSNFDFSAGTWGAFEVAARYATLSIDDKAFPLYANPSTNANNASSVGLGLNWYLSKAVRFTFDYYHTTFGFNAAATSNPPAAPSVLHQDENVYISRFQLSF